MGTFDRLGNVVKGAVSGAVGDLERANPAAVYEAAIDNAIAQVDRHKQAAAALAAQRDRLEEAVQRLEREQVQLRSALAEALAEGDDDTAVVLVARRDEVERAAEDKRRERDEVAGHVDDTVEALRALREEVEALKRERHTAIAELEVAQAQVELDDLASGLSTTASSKGLDSVRSAIRVLDAVANEGYLDSEGNSVRGQAEALGRKAAEADARAQLEELKRQRAKASGDEDDEPEDPVKRRL